MATKPPGTPPKYFTPPNQLARITAKHTTPITGVEKTWAAGLIEMKVIEMPASEPSRAARGVMRRITGPTNPPAISTKLWTNTQVSPASQASTGLPVFTAIGSMTTKVTTNICGTLMPDGSAQTSDRPVRLASRQASQV